MFTVVRLWDEYVWLRTEPVHWNWALMCAERNSGQRQPLPHGLEFQPHDTHKSWLDEGVRKADTLEWWRCVSVVSLGNWTRYGDDMNLVTFGLGVKVLLAEIRMFLYNSRIIVYYEFSKYRPAPADPLGHAVRFFVCAPWEPNLILLPPQLVFFIQTRCGWASAEFIGWKTTAFGWIHSFFPSDLRSVFM